MLVIKTESCKDRNFICPKYAHMSALKVSFKYNSLQAFRSTKQAKRKKPGENWQTPRRDNFPASTKYWKSSSPFIRIHSAFIRRRSRPNFGSLLLTLSSLGERPGRECRMAREANKSTLAAAILLPSSSLLTNFGPAQQN